MKFNIDRGLLRSAELGDFELTDFGVEFSDHFSFCTLTEVPRCTRIELIGCTQNETSSAAEYRINLAEGFYQLSIETTINIDESAISITAKLLPLNDAVIQDFVVRIKVRNASVATAKISDQIFEHSNSEIYRQFTTADVKLIANSGQLLEIRRTAQSNENAEWQMYARDLEGFWIIHSRLFPKKNCDTLWLRWINRHFWLSFSAKLSNQIGKIGWLREFLWYRKERLGKRGPHLQLIGMIPVTKEREILQSVELRLFSHE